MRRTISTRTVESGTRETPATSGGLKEKSEKEKKAIVVVDREVVRD